MDLLKGDMLTLTVLLLVPGVVAMKVYDLFVASERRDWSKQLAEAIASGAFNFALWSPFLAALAERRKDHPYLIGLATFGMMFFTPVCLALVFNGLLRASWMRRWMRHPIQQAWDHFFSRQPDCWVLVRLKAGGYVGGRWGFAGSFPARDLYLREVWRVDEGGRFLEKIPGTAGLLISANEVEFIEFFNEESGEEAEHARREETPSGRLRAGEEGIRAETVTEPDTVPAAGRRIGAGSTDSVDAGGAEQGQVEVVLRGAANAPEEGRK